MLVHCGYCYQLPLQRSGSFPWHALHATPVGLLIGLLASKPVRTSIRTLIVPLTPVPKILIFGTLRRFMRLLMPQNGYFSTSKPPGWPVALARMHFWLGWPGGME